MQIDQYLNHKKIPAIHCIGRDSWYPKWFNFTSGTVNTELSKFQLNKDYFDRNSENAISPEGNTLMFNKLVDLFNAASSREALC